MYCMQCGQELPANAKFCLKCGGKIQNVVYFYCKTKTGANAKGYPTANGFTVCAGSKIVRNCTSNSFLEGNYYPLLNKLINMGVIRNFAFTTDYTFASATAAADVVTQGNVSGNEYWVDANGIKLKEYK